MIRACTACGANNRIPAKHLSDTGRCGSCKATLPPVSEPIEVDASQFAEITSEAKVPVLVDFWAEWCQPCRMAAPEVHALAREMAGRGLILKVNTEVSGPVDSIFRTLARRDHHRGADGDRSTGRDAAMVRHGGVRLGSLSVCGAHND